MLERRDQQAAAVAARLLAFRANPAGLAPYYQQGIEPLPEGGIVLRFAQGKIPQTLSREFAQEETQAIRDAADEFVRRVCLWERADHYQVLCARRDAPCEAIKENYHLLMALMHPDRQDAGGARTWPESCAQRVNLAYATLGDESARRDYDGRLRTERPSLQATANAGERLARRRAHEVRFAKTLLAVSAVVAILVVVALSVEDDEWGDRSVLQASLARLRVNPVAGADRPRYVGATASAPALRANDAIVEDAQPFNLFKPLMRFIVAEEPKALIPAPKIEPPPPPAIPNVSRPDRPTVSVFPVAIAIDAPPTASIAQASPLVVSPAPTAATLAPRVAGDVARPSNLEIESLVVALIGYYEAGDAERLVGLVDGGFWRNAQMRQTYSDFFRGTRTRRLRVERLAWSTQSGAARAKGEAIITAEYFDRTSPVERRVDLELDIGIREGKARITRLSMFPESP